MSVLTLRIFYLPGLIDIRAAVLLRPATVILVKAIRLLAGDGDAVPLSQPHLDLAQHQYDLLRTWPMTSIRPQRLWSKLMIAIRPLYNQPVRLLFSSGLTTRAWWQIDAMAGAP